MGLKWSISGSLSSRLVRKENLTKILQASENKFIHSTTQYLWVQKDFKAEKSQLPKQRGSGPGRIRQRIFRPWTSRTHKKNSAPRQKDSNQGII